MAGHSAPVAQFFFKVCFLPSAPSLPLSLSLTHTHITALLYIIPSANNGTFGSLYSLLRSEVASVLPPGTYVRMWVLAGDAFHFSSTLVCMLASSLIPTPPTLHLSPSFALSYWLTCRTSLPLPSSLHPLLSAPPLLSSPPFLLFHNSSPSAPPPAAKTHVPLPEHQINCPFPSSDTVFYHRANLTCQDTSCTVS